MAALTGDRKTNTAARGLRSFPVLAGAVLFEGALVAVDANGWARPARTVASNVDRIVGRAEMRADNTSGGNGAIRVSVRCDEIVYLVNSAVTAIADKDIGQSCFAEDDQTVCLTAVGSTQVRAGKIHHLLNGLVGVWVDQ